MSAICAVNDNGVILKYSMQFSDWPGPVTLTKNTGTNYNGSGHFSGILKINQSSTTQAFLLTTLFRCRLNLVTNNADPETTTLVTRRDQNLRGNNSVSRVLFRVRFLLSGTSLVVKTVSVLVTILNSLAIKDDTKFFFINVGRKP